MNHELNKVLIQKGFIVNTTKKLIIESLNKIIINNYKKNDI